jgi:sulfur-oxidizing protein SoxB
LYRRGNFSGTADQLILDGLMAEKNTEIAFSPGFRWGTTLLSGQAITFEHLMDQTAITYPYVTVNELTGETIKTILEDVADNLFNPDPYYQQGGDMVRVGGLSYTIAPSAAMGRRITAMTLRGSRSSAKNTRSRLGAGIRGGEGGRRRADLGLMARYLKSQRTINPLTLNLPKSKGWRGIRGWRSAGTQLKYAPACQFDRRRRRKRTKTPQASRPKFFDAVMYDSAQRTRRIGVA